MNNQIIHNLTELRKHIPQHVTLVAVSKTCSPEIIMEAHRAGQRVFGENRVQELIQKQAILPNDTEWHLIGHLQNNKIKHIAPFVKLIHSIDSLKLLININKEAKKNNRVIDCLLQFHIGEESTKFGMDTVEAEAILNDTEYKTLQYIRITGVMGMATFTDNQQQIRAEFQHLNNIFQHLKLKYFADYPCFKEISMGMSEDYPVAIEEGATIIRVGSAIFGKRRDLLPISI
jgi:pyridoxal phosphate enzyme (YggS family)